MDKSVILEQAGIRAASLQRGQKVSHYEYVYSPTSGSRQI